MEILELDAGAGRLIDHFDSHEARHIGVARLDGRGAISIIRLGAGSILGRHPAVVDQLYCVIDGEGWVSGSDQERRSIRAGQAAYWTMGEEHESGSQTGMTALVVEAQQCTVK